MVENTDTVDDSELFYFYRENVPFSPVVAMCAVNEHLVVFRRDCSVSLVDQKLDNVVFRFFLDFGVLQAFSHKDIAICRSSKNKMYRLRISETLIGGYSVEQIKDYNFNHLLSTQLPAYNSVNQLSFFVYAENKRLMHLSMERIPSCLLRCKSTITFFCYLEFFLFVSLENFEFLVYEINSKSLSLKLVSESMFGEKATSVCSVSSDTVTVSLANGELLLYNYKNGIVEDRVFIRDNTAVFSVLLDGVLFSSGEDSRIILHKLERGFPKIIQKTYHSSEVLSLIISNGYVYSSGEDSLVIKHSFEKENLVGIKIFDSHLFTGVFNTDGKEFFYTANKEALNVFYYDDSLSPQLNSSSIDNSTRDFSKSMLIDKITVSPEMTSDNLNHFMRFSLHKKFISFAAVSPTGKYFVFSTHNKTVLYSLRQGSSVRVEIVKEFKAVATSACFVANDNVDFLLFLSNSSIQIFNISDMVFTEKVDIKFSYGNFMTTNSNMLFVGGTNQLFSISKGCRLELVDLPGLDSHKISCGEFCDSKLVLVDAWNIKRFEIDIPSFAISEFSLDYEYRYGNRPEGICINRYICTAKNIVSLKSSRVYNLFPLIHGIHWYNNKLLVVQSFWQSIKKQFQNSIFREKYSNK